MGAVIKRGMHSTSTPTGYGWAVPNYTLAPTQYAPGPMPAPAWPVSDYSVFGDGADYQYGSVGVLERRMLPGVPNWALLAGGAVLLYSMKGGKKVPFRKNPYGVPFLGVPLLGGALVIGGSLLGAKTLFNVGNIFSGASGVGLGLGLGLGGLYAMKNGDKVFGTAMAGAFLGWGLGFAYEKSQEAATEGSGGLLTRSINWLV